MNTTEESCRRCKQQEIVARKIFCFFCVFRLTPVTAALSSLAFPPWSSTPCSRCSCHHRPLPPLLPPQPSPLPPPLPHPQAEEPPSSAPFSLWRVCPGWRRQTSEAGPCVPFSGGCSARPLAECLRPTGLQIRLLRSCWPLPSCARASACSPGRQWRSHPVCDHGAFRCPVKRGNQTPEAFLKFKLIIVSPRKMFFQAGKNIKTQKQATKYLLLIKNFPDVSYIDVLRERTPTK